MSEVTKVKFAIQNTDGKHFCPLKKMFLPPEKGYRYGTRAMAQKSLNAALMRYPAMLQENPEIIPIHS